MAGAASSVDVIFQKRPAAFWALDFKLSSNACITVFMEEVWELRQSAVKETLEETMLEAAGEEWMEPKVMTVPSFKHRAVSVAAAMALAAARSASARMVRGVVPA